MDMQGMCKKLLLHAVIFSAIVSYMVMPTRANSASWEVLYGNTDLSDAASPITTASGILLNATNIGPILGILVSPEASGFRLQSPDGKIWRWTFGDNSLIADGDIIPLAVPGIQQGRSLFLDADSLSKLAGLELTVKSDSNSLIFNRPEFMVLSSQEETSDEYRYFTIPKPKADHPVTSAILTTQSTNPPPNRDRLDIGFGLGHVQNADWGMELTASGKIRGGNTNFYSFFTQGSQGLQLRNVHLSWLDRETKIGYEAGDLYSESWGLLKGMRFSWNDGYNHNPSLGAYIDSSRTQNPKPLISYRDELKINNNLNVCGELGTDKSRFASLNFKSDRMNLYGFSRYLPDGLGRGSGIFSTYAVSPNVSLYYGWNSQAYAQGGESTSNTYGLQLPLFKRYNLVLEQTNYDSDDSSAIYRSAGITIPVANNAFMYVRYQKNSSGRNVFSAVPVYASSDSLLTSLSLFASPRLHFDYQLSTYSQEGVSTTDQQMIANYTISPRSSLQAITGFPNIADTDLLRLRLTRQLDNGMSLLVDYGRLSPYQNESDVFGKRGFMIMLRKTWPTSVPARGSKVTGYVLDQTGQPIKGVIIWLGNYSVESDNNGKYVFECIPTGTYDIRIDENSVPADYKVLIGKQDVNVKRGSSQTIDFKLVPLGSISGIVFLDKDGNGKYDRGEGVSDIPVAIDERGTATDNQGRFSFYNMDPGRYKVRVAQELLYKQYVLVGAGEVDVELMPKESVSGIVFQITEYKRPIIFIKSD